MHAPEHEALVNSSHAEALMKVGMYRQSGTLWEEAIASFRLHGDRRMAAICEFHRAVVAYESGDYGEAREWSNRAMQSLYEQGIETWAFLARVLGLQVVFDSEHAGPDFPTKVEVLCHALESRGWTFRLEQARALAARAHILAEDLDSAAERLAMPVQGDGYGFLSADLARHLALAELARARNEDPFPELHRGLNLLAEYRTQFGSVEFQAGVSALGVQLASCGLRWAAERGEPSAMLAWAERCRAQALRIPPVKSSADPHAREALGRLRQARQRLWDAQLEGSDDAE